MIHIALPSAPLAAYLVVGLVASLDLLLPILTPGALLLAGGALAAKGELSLILLVAIGAAGAWFGDLAGYRIGRRTTRGAAHSLVSGVSTAAPPSQTGSGRLRWIRRHPLVTLVIARYVPVGRTIATITAGRLAQPWQGYVLAALAAELLWAAPMAELGYLGGQLIPPGIVVVTAVAGVAATAIIALVRRRRARRAPTP